MSHKPKNNELLFLPLGGAGEIGMNLSLYGHAGQWLMVDLGVTFGDDSTPGIDIIMPDITFIEERVEDLIGLVLTHAHEDHIGAVPYLWRKLRCPLYATPFTAALLRRKLAEAGLEKEATIHILPMSGKAEIGKFTIELITLTHSIPEPNAVVIRTPLGPILHTGDWKLDPEPLIGESTDIAALRALGDKGVLAMICDSTNVLVPGTSGSEADIREHLKPLIAKAKGRVFVGCFASNVARLESIAFAAREAGREVALVGRSLHRMVSAARETGYLTDFPNIVSEENAGFVPHDKILLICTGSQGEPRSALARIARDEHPHVTIEEGDVVIFSSRVIPGNEKSILSLQNDLAILGADIITDRDENIHVSGHPARDELVEMYQWVRPNIAIPVHGEARHLHAHAELAKECQVPHVVIPENGSLIRLAPGEPEIIGQVQSGRWGLDGNRLIPLEHVKKRQRMAYNGVIMVTIVLGVNGALMAPPKVSLEGLLDDGPMTGEAEEAIAREIEDHLFGSKNDDEAMAEITRLAARRYFFKTYQKKPVIKVHIVRV